MAKRWEIPWRPQGGIVSAVMRWAVLSESVRCRVSCDGVRIDSSVVGIEDSSSQRKVPLHHCTSANRNRTYS